MRERESKNSGIGAFIIGAAVGAVAALMLAPFSGRKMRKITQEKGKEALGKARLQYTNAEDKLNNVADRTKNYFNRTREKAANKADEVGATLRGQTENAADIIEEAADRVEEKTDRL